MNDTSRMKLHSVLSSLEIEANDIAIELEDSNIKIVNLEKEINKIQNSFSENDVIFSPRKDRYPSEELKQKKENLEILKQEHEHTKKKYDQLNENIEMIVDVLSHEGEKASNKGALLFHEQDRQRIARDLHELAITNLSYLVEKINILKEDIDRDPEKAKMDVLMAKTSLSSVIENIRSVVYDLRPIEFKSGDFKEKILTYIEKFNSDHKYNIETDIDDIVCDDQIVLRTIFQIVEESLQNIRKHAEAYSIHIIIQEQIGLYYIYIEDDGRGFDVDAIGKGKSFTFGIQMMKERVELLGGNITISSANNAGTKIKILIPIS